MTEHSDPYDRLARLYDFEHADFEDDVEVYLALARAAGGPALELGCGTGRLMAALARAGLEVTGVDRSAAMLERARRRLAPFGERCRLVQAPMEGFALPSGFGLAIIALDGFAHLLRRADQRACLGRTFAALRPGGLLAIDLHNPDLVALAQSWGQLLWTAEFHDTERDLIVTRFTAITVDVARQMQSARLVYDSLPASGVGMVERVTAELRTRFLFRPEMEALLEDAGFAVEQAYGGYDLTEYASDSPRLILVARRA